MSAPGTKRTCRLRCAMSALRGKAENICSQRVFPLLTAGSTGRRNTGIKSLCWGFKLQGLTWSFIELTSHFVQIGLRVHRQVGETSEEHPMLMHFSMIVLSSQLVVAVADHPPAFDIARGCKVDSASAFDPNAGMNATIKRCMTTNSRQRICSRHNGWGS